MSLTIVVFLSSDIMHSQLGRAGSRASVHAVLKVFCQEPGVILILIPLFSMFLSLYAMTHLAFWNLEMMLLSVNLLSLIGPF